MIMDLLKNDLDFLSIRQMGVSGFVGAHIGNQHILAGCPGISRARQHFDALESAAIEQSQERPFL
jgi:hypothetical protein